MLVCLPIAFAMNKNIILEVKNLCVEYPNETTKIQNISFSLEKGKVLGLVGESGSGKSTVGKTVLGLLYSRAGHISGSIRLCGRELLNMSFEQHRKLNGKDIGYIMQNPMTAFDPCMRIKTHFIETICAHLPCSKKDALHIGSESLSQTGLKDINRVMNSFPHQLSGGMLQRVMISIAVSLNPVLIIADEPTTALDAENKGIVLELLKGIIKKYRPAMLFISHDIEVVSEVADEVAVMQQGKIVEYGKTKNVLSRPKNECTRELLKAVHFSMENELCLE